MFRFLIILLCLNFFYYYCSSNGVIYLPFKKQIPNIKNLDSDDIIYKGLQYNKIITEISIGTKPQIIPMIITLNHYDFFVTGEELNKSENKLNTILFNQSKSSTFKTFGEFNEYGGRGFLHGYKSSDYFYLDNNHIENKYNISFILATDPDDGISGMIGLKLNEEDIIISGSNKSNILFFK